MWWSHIFLNDRYQYSWRSIKVKTHSIVWVEDVRGRRVIQDEGLVEISAQPAQVFDIAALVEYTRFPE